MMQPALTIVGGLSMIVLETVVLRLFGIVVWAPQLAVLAVVYVSLRRNFNQAALATFFFSAAADASWGGPRGYYALGLVAVFLAVWVSRGLGRRLGTMQIALFVIPAVLLTDFVALTTLALFQRGASPLGALVSISPLIALWTGFVAFPLAWFQGFVDRVVERRETAGL